MENTNNTNVLPTDTQPIVNPQPAPPTKNKISSKVLVLGIVVGIILTASIASAVYFYQLSKKPPQVTSPNNSTDKISESPNTQPATINDKINYDKFGALTWLDEPKKISPLNIFNLDLPKQRQEQLIDPNFDLSEAEYYQIGTFSNNAQLINVYFTPHDPSGLVLARFIKDKDKIYLLTNMIVNRNLEDFKEFLLNNVSFLDLKIEELIPPLTITLSDNNILNLYGSEFGSSQKISDFKNLKNFKKIIDSKYGPIYTNFINGEPSLNEVVTKVTYLKLKDSTLVIYSYEIESSDDQIPKIIWDTGYENAESYSSSTFTGCSIKMLGNIQVILKNSTILNNKIEIGKTTNGDPVYQIKDKNNSIVTNLYNTYKQARVGNDNEKIISLDEFVEQGNHFLWQEPSGDWQIFINNDYGSLAECGKPVIYLYPQTDTQVKVQVGAQITISEPTYPEDGWLVTAKPNGQLTYQNQNYPYLFWEGLGNGLYPDYRDRGTVVAQIDLVSTLYQQLSQLGLNQKESADFMEFWQPKLPQTPYVRLTWLNTKDMDTLAPLWVNPKPDTSIRIFLEFQGLNKPVKLIPQTLSAPTRQGFTLIEWGGLLLTARD